MGASVRDITQARLREVLSYNQTNGKFVWAISRKGAGKGSIAGSIGIDGYLNIVIDGTSYRAHRLAWLYVYGYFPEGEIDHISRNRTNNRINNLREVSRQCNMRNTGNIKTNTSGVKGVCWGKQRGKWHASITVNQKQIYLGHHQDFIEAVYHRLAAEQAENWAGCDSSSPAYKYVTKHHVENKN